MKVDSLEEYIINNFGNENNDLKFKIMALYYEFTKTHINNFSELKNSPETFGQFLTSHYDLICECSGGDCGAVLSEIVAIKKALNERINSLYIHKTQKCFADIIKDIVERKNTRVLDVGAGLVAYSSILLGEDLHNVSTLDKNFWLSNECFQKLNVSAHQGYLTKDTNISDFDMLVGRMPCTAIDAMVYLCKKYNKKYFIETCSCEMPTIGEFYEKWDIDKDDTYSPPKKWNSSGRFSSLDSPITGSTKNWISWEKMLPEIDENIVFSGNYAFNLGEKKDSIENIILKHKRKEKTLI